MITVTLHKFELSRISGTLEVKIGQLHGVKKDSGIIKKPDSLKVITHLNRSQIFGKLSTSLFSILQAK